MDKTLAVAIGIVLALVLVGGYVLFGPDFSQETRNSKGPVETNKVTIKGFEFQPPSIRVEEGTTVTWINKDLSLHAVKAKSFKSGNIDTYQKYQHKFEQRGTYTYICSIHTFMEGKVIVE